MRRDLQETIVIQENVKAFSGELFTKFLGHVYHIDSAVIDPRFFSFPVARERKYTVLRHKMKIMEHVTSLSRFVRRFFTASNCTWR